MAFLAGLGMLAVIVLLIVMPLVRKPGSKLSPPIEEPEELYYDKEKVLAALNELEYDYSMHKLEEADYRVLKESLMKQAISLMKEEEMIAPEVKEQVDLERQLEMEIEKEVARLLGESSEAAVGAKNADYEADREPKKADHEAQKVDFCPECGTKLLSAEQKYCHACGSKVLLPSHG